MAGWKGTQERKRTTHGSHGKGKKALSREGHCWKQHVKLVLSLAVNAKVGRPEEKAGALAECKLIPE